jgi:thiamine-monophosphate kinase
MPSSPTAAAGRPAPGTSDRGAIAELGERALIERIRARLGPQPGWLLVDAGDDAAVYEGPRNAVEVVTTDAVVDGVHVSRAFVSALDIGHRALAVNLSDLAAMGAAPRLATLSMALPEDLPVADFDALVGGLLALASRTRTRLVGGNITRIAGPLVVDITAIGVVHRRKVLTRGGARPGDYVFVSGTLGDARAGLARLQSTPAAGLDLASYPVARYLRPEPRLRLGQLLARRRAATSAVDLSDGLADGLARLAEASGLGIAIDLPALPIHAETASLVEAAGLDPVREAVLGGDDYELLFTVNPKRLGALRGVAKLVGDLGLTRIGRVTRTSGIALVHPDGRQEAAPGGYEHFLT